MTEGNETKRNANRKTFENTSCHRLRGTLQLLAVSQTNERKKKSSKNKMLQIEQENEVFSSLFRFSKVWVCWRCHRHVTQWLHRLKCEQNDEKVISKMSYRQRRAKLIDMHLFATNLVCYRFSVDAGAFLLILFSAVFSLSFKFCEKEIDFLVFEFRKMPENNKLQLRTLSAVFPATISSGRPKWHIGRDGKTRQLNWRL